MRASRPTPDGAHFVNAIAERLHRVVAPKGVSGIDEAAPDVSPRPPGPQRLPFLGNAVRYVHQDPFRFLPEVAAEYGPVVRWEFLGRTVYQLNEPADVEHVLVHNNQNYTKGAVFQRSLAVTGEGLLNADGEAWRRQ